MQLLDETGAVIWEGTVNAIAGEKFMARFLVPGLQPGSSYNFRVIDEVGKLWQVPGITVGSFNAGMTSASLAGITLSFDSLPDGDYEIQWVEQLGGSWTPVTNLTATGEQTSVLVAYPDPTDPSGFFRVLAK